MMTTVIEARAMVDLPDRTRRTAEKVDGRPTVHRFFSKLVVVAASLSSLDKSRSSMVGEIVAAYANRPGFSRTTLRDVEVEGAQGAAEFLMRWTASSGDEISSTVRVARGEDFGVVLHATCPGQFMDDYDTVIREIVESLRFDVEPPSPAE